MSKLWGIAALVCAAWMAAPVFAQDAADVGRIERGGQEKAETTTKLDKVLGWSTSDGAFALKLENRVQFRVTYNDERSQFNDATTGPGQGGSNGRDFWNFRVRRVKTTFSGHIFEKQFQYKVTAAWTAAAGEIVETAVFTWAAHAMLNVNAGQDKLTWNWQEIVSSGRQLFVDRSVANEFFNQDFAKGLWLSGAQKDDTATWLKYWIGIYNGVLKGAGDFRNADVLTTAEGFKNAGSGGPDADLMFNLRLETHPMGEVAQDMMDSRGEDKHDVFLLAVGLAINWFASDLVNADFRPLSVAGATGSGRARASQDTLAVTADLHLRFMGLSVDFEFYMRHTEFHYQGAEVGRNGAALGLRTRPTNLDDTGMTLEIAYFLIPKSFNVGVRVSTVDGEDFFINNVPGAGIVPDALEAGLVLGYYLQGHNLKVQADFTHVSYQLVDFRAGAQREPVARLNPLPDRSASSRANDVSDYLTLWQFRVQIQWIF